MLKTKLPAWLARYNKLLIGLVGLTFILWLLQIQVFNIALIPLLLALVLRYGFLIKFQRKTTSS